MTVDKLDLFGPKLAEIGNEALRLAGGEGNGLFLYVEIGDGWTEPSLFKDEDSVIRYIDFDDPSPLDDLLTEAWCLEPVDKRWTAMHYTIEHGKFDATFDYDDLEGSEEDGGDRRERILRARYGDRKITYPPFPSDAWTLQPPS